MPRVPTWAWDHLCTQVGPGAPCSSLAPPPLAVGLPKRSVHPSPVMFTSLLVDLAFFYISCLFQQHYQNFQLLGAWCLLNSLFLILNLSPTALADKGKEKDPLAALRVRDILSRTKEGVGSPKLGPGKGYVSIRCCSCWFSCCFLLMGSWCHASRLHSSSKACLYPVPVNNEDGDRSSLSLYCSYVVLGNRSFFPILFPSL